MVKASTFEEEEVEEMRASLVHEGWQASEALPEKWMMKGGGGKDHNSIKFVNEVGEKFESTRAALDHVKSRSAVEAGDVEKLCRFTRLVKVNKELESAGTEKKMMNKIGQNVKSVNDDTARFAISGGDDDDWREDDELPEGWKTKNCNPVKNKADHEAFLTPSGKHLTSRLALIDQLKKEGLDSEWIDRARSGLGQFGWVQDPRLPKGFLRRENSGKTEFYTESCKRVEGQAKLLELLLQEGYGFKVVLSLYFEICC